MSVDAHAQNLLNEFKTGKEINWDYIPALVLRGEIAKTDVLVALKQCLDIAIPKYRKNAQSGDAQYWGNRLQEAEQAAISMDRGQIVKYRDIELQ